MSLRLLIRGDLDKQLVQPERAWFVGKAATGEGQLSFLSIDTRRGDYAVNYGY